ncbi:hypothetical protein [Actinoallomurus sp. NPDC050550]|uniref:hypothetical protein n=1 Tax=Actinoallomurus sp. NPDC050550 TaxID=3154937 RepID=UPI0033CCE7F8
MNTVAEWSERIARRVTPDEVDFAADVGEAYAAGGGSRAALFDRPGAEPGGFGLVSAIGELPVILAALADTGRVLRHALATQELGNAVAVASLWVSLRGARTPPTVPEDTKAGPGDARAVSGDARAMSGDTRAVSGDMRAMSGDVQAMPDDAQVTPADDARTALTRAYAELRDRLRSLGFPPERAERLARELLEELLADAVSAEDFIRRLDGGKR